MPTDYQRTLIDAFFHEQNQQLRKAFRERLEKMDRRAQLAQVSDIQDEAVLDRLIELNVDPETLAALEIIPLVAVAWADGKVQDEERNAILAAAQTAGIPSKDGRYPILEFWLNQRPGRQMLEAWEHYIKDICKRTDQQELAELKKDVLGLAKNVAQAAGGFLGLGNKISSAEASVLGRLEKAFA